MHAEFLVVKPEVQRPLSRPGRKWESNGKINFTEIGGGGMQKLDSSGMEKHKWQCSCEQGIEPSGLIECWKFLG